MRAPALLLAASFGAFAHAQDAPEPGNALVFSESIAVPLAKAAVIDAALSAWEFTFGQEPGAQLERQDQGTGVFEATARMNYRSTMLNSREETMGSVAYRITIRCENGVCKVQAARFMHTGNHRSPQGGIDLGPIYAGDRPLGRVRGVGQNTAQRIHADIRDRTIERITQLMKGFSARVRAAGTP